jgi:hypothetical protein
LYDASVFIPANPSSVDLFVKDFKSLYPGHPNLDAYIFGGGGNSAQLKVRGENLS